MSIFFQDPGETRLPPAEVRLNTIQVIPIGDGKRLRVQLELTPFQQRPNLEVIVSDPTGKEVGHTTILETLLTKLDFYLHLREHEPGLEYRLEVRVYYQRMPQASPEPADIDLPERVIVDEKKTVFELHSQDP